MRATILMLVLFCSVSVAQDVRPLLQDPKALEFLDKADKLAHSAKAAGLKDLSYTQTLSQFPGLVVEVKWMLPDLRAAKVSVKPDAPEHTRRIAASLEASLKPQVLQLLDNVIGKENRATYATDEISLVSERLVRIVPRSERNKKMFSERLITYDLRGLPVVTKSTTLGGVVQDIHVAWEAVGTTGRYRVQSVSGEAGKAKSELRYAYVTVGNYELVKSITMETTENAFIFGFDNYKADSGLSAKDFAGS